MGTINIANSAGRDAVVGSQTVVKPIKVRWLDDNGRQAQPARLMKADLSHDLAALETKAGGRDKIAQTLTLSGPVPGGMRFLDSHNVPDSGFGM